MYRTALYEVNYVDPNSFWFTDRIPSPFKRGREFSTMPHYQDTAEFVFVENISGSAVIEGRHIEFGERTALYIPGGDVHSMRYESGDGEIFVAKLDLAKLSEFINIEKILDRDGLTADSFDCLIPNDRFDRVKNAFLKIESTDSMREKLTAVLEIFCALVPVADARSEKPVSEDLKNIIAWTEKNLSSGILLESAASTLGYSKNYFCDKFKRISGVTYMNFVNHLRVSRACGLLAKGKSLAEVCAECGFVNESYFIRLFSKIMHITPAKWRAQHSAIKPPETSENGSLVKVDARIMNQPEIS